MSTTAPEAELSESARKVLDLYRAGTTSPTEISKALGVTSQAIHGHFRRLRERGLIPPVGEPTGRPARSGRRERGVEARIDPHAAIMAAVEGIRQQEAALQTRLEQIGEDRLGLDLEEKQINESLNALKAMQAASAQLDGPSEQRAAA